MSLNMQLIKINEGKLLVPILVLSVETVVLVIWNTTQGNI